VGARDAGEGLLYDELDVGGIRGILGDGRAYVTPSAAVGARFVVGGEVAQDTVVPAGPAFGPTHQVEKETPLVLDDLRWCWQVAAAAFDEASAHGQVLFGRAEHSDGWGIVASCASDFLVVGFDRARRREVDDDAHVRAVDTHAERVGCDDDGKLPTQEGALDLGAKAAVEAGVVGLGGPSRPSQTLGFARCLIAGGRVHDGGAAWGLGIAQSLAQGSIDDLIPLARTVDLEGTKGKVVAREAPDDLRGVGAETEAGDDLVSNDWRRGRGACQDPRLREGTNEGANGEVVRSEIVPPLADAMRFVHGEERAVELRQQIAKSPRRETLRSNVDQSILTLTRSGEAHRDFARFESRGEIGGRYASGIEAIHLILHQRNQRRDDEGRAWQERSGELIGQALASSSRGDEEDSALVEEDFDRLALTRAKMREAQRLKASVEIGGRTHGARVRGERLPKQAFGQHLTDAVYGVTCRTLLMTKCSQTAVARGRRAGRFARVVLATIFTLLAVGEIAWANPSVGLPPPPEDLDRSTPRRTVQIFLEATARADFKRAAYALDLRDVPAPEQELRGPDLARMLRHVLRRTVRIDVPSISDEPAGDPSDGLMSERIASIPLNGSEVPLRLTRIPLSKTEVVWAISRHTVRSIPELYDELGPGWFGRRMPEWTHRETLLSLPMWQWMGILVLGAASALVGWALAGLLLFVARRVVHQTEPGWDEHLFDGIRGPLRLLTATAIFGVAVSTLRLSVSVDAAGLKIIGTGIIVAVAWLVMRVVRAVSLIVAQRLTEDQDDEVVRQGTSSQVAVGRRIINSLVFIVAAALALLQFQVVRQVGFSVLASAGIAGVVFGLAAQRVLGNFLAGIQLSISRPVRIGDRVLVEGQFGFIEEVGLTFVVVKTWDERRIILPITYMIETPFENWTRTDKQLIGVVMLYVDFRAPVQRIRDAFVAFVQDDPDWDGETVALVVLDVTDQTMALRGIASGDAKTVFDLRCRVREKMVEFLQGLDGGIHLPRTRVELPRPLPDGSNEGHGAT
jgi:small-conductance mechanosensitive channel